MAEGKPGRGEAARGDHLQTGYQLWLVGHQLEHGRAPWRDPYSFQPEVKPRWNLAGWPFGLVYWPLQRAFGTVAAWNLFVLLGFLGAGGFAALWLRQLGLRRGAALTGGLAFALAPYLQAHWSAGHLLAWIAMLLPLSLYAVERARRGSKWWLVLAGAALTPRSRSRASSTSHSVRFPSLRSTRSSASAGRLRSSCRRSQQACSPTSQSSAARQARAAAPSVRSSTTPPTCPTSCRGVRTSSRGSSSSAGRSCRSPSPGWSCCSHAAPVGTVPRARARRARSRSSSPSARTFPATRRSGDTCPGYGIHAFPSG